MVCKVSCSLAEWPVEWMMRQRLIKASCIPAYCRFMPIKQITSPLSHLFLLCEVGMIIPCMMFGLKIEWLKDTSRLAHVMHWLNVYYMLHAVFVLGISNKKELVFKGLKSAITFQNFTTIHNKKRILHHNPIEAPRRNWTKCHKISHCKASYLTLEMLRVTTQYCTLLMTRGWAGGQTCRQRRN